MWPTYLLCRPHTSLTTYHSIEPNCSCSLVGLRTQCHRCFCEKIKGWAWRSGCPGKMRLSCNCLESQVVGQAMLQQLEKRIQRNEWKEVHIACNNFIWFWWKTQLKRSTERKQLHFYGIFKFCICHIKRLNKVKLRENSDIEKGNDDWTVFLLFFPISTY